MRLALLLLLGACSFDHGRVIGATGDGGPTDDTGSDSGPTLRTRKLVFDNSASTADFTAFPVLVALDASTIDYALVNDPATDLRFEYASQGTAASPGDSVPFEIERWNPGGESLVWIRVPEIPHGSTDTAVLMHYGQGAGGQADVGATWADWELVNHMTADLASSAGSYTATSVNTTVAAGQMGEAAGFASGGDHRVTFANAGALFDGWVEWTLSFWLYADYADADALGNAEPGVMDKGGPLVLGRLYRNGEDLRFQVDLHFEANVVYAYLISLPARTWTMVTITSDGDALYIAKNGNAFGSAELTGTNQALLSSTQSYFLGSANNCFTGSIDELRIERRFRPNDYVHAQYLAMTRQFVTFTDP
ncbi:MAG TPA: LamG-like jellyroll fold domain-containing protein [Kofleriaceae bacterium]|nr:LamG-like jellyroll fold domain-containing protein [Kofleriaceae bacterium]